VVQFLLKQKMFQKISSSENIPLEKESTWANFHRNDQIVAQVKINQNC